MSPMYETLCMSSTTWITVRLAAWLDASSIAALSPRLPVGLPSMATRICLNMPVSLSTNQGSIVPNSTGMRT